MPFKVLCGQKYIKMAPSSLTENNSTKNIIFSEREKFYIFKVG
jgi:hypothetical protein